MCSSDLATRGVSDVIDSGEMEATAPTITQRDSDATGRSHHLAKPALDRVRTEQFGLLENPLNCVFLNPGDSRAV